MSAHPAINIVIIASHDDLCQVKNGMEDLNITLGAGSQLLEKWIILAGPDGSEKGGYLTDPISPQCPQRGSILCKVLSRPLVKNYMGNLIDACR